MMKPKVIDLFAGVGGLSLGFENRGFDVVLANEYDPSIAAAYERLYRENRCDNWRSSLPRILSKRAAKNYS